MKRALIVQQDCRGCVPCAVDATCGHHAVIRESDADKPWVDFYKCTGCLKCKAVCPNQAVEEITQPCTGQGRRSW